MRALCVVLGVVLGAARAGLVLELSDEQYYQMPRLFHLDDYDECLASTRGAFCLGSFALRSASPAASPLFEVLQNFSRNLYNFNHTQLHRGYCISSRCTHINEPNPRVRFQKCVNYFSKKQYGLEARVTRLEYCHTREDPQRPIDAFDTAFAGVIGVILVLNVVGTVYDLQRSSDSKPNKYLVAWSLRANWHRLTATHEDGDPRLTALNPIQGVRTFNLVIVMFAHSILANYMTYQLNPGFFEVAHHHPLSAIVQNGPVVVQTFFVISSFLLTYNLLLQAETSPTTMRLAMLPQCLLHRIVRIAPMHLFMVGLTVSWWPRISSGALWEPLVQAEAERCRAKWWAHALFLHNFVHSNVNCLLPTWFLAVDMQLYAAVAALALAAAGGRRAPALLAALVLAAVAANFAVAYHWRLKPMVMAALPESMRVLYSGDASFKWMYISPWSNLPGALLGVLFAVLYHRMQSAGYKPGENKYIRLACNVAVPLLPAWILGGYLVKGVTSPAGAAAYAALDRPTFALLVSAAMLGFFTQTGNIWWRFMSWRGWQPLGRMSLTILLVHWLYNLTLVSVRNQAVRLSVYDIGGHWFVVMFMTYLTSLPLHLLVELPSQRFLQAFFVRK